MYRIGLNQIGLKQFTNSLTYFSLLPVVSYHLNIMPYIQPH